MPSPVAHSLAAAALAALTGKLQTASLDRGRPVSSRWWLVALMGAAIAPDFDFVPGVLIGRPDWLHRGASHSLGAALLFGAICGLVARLLRVGSGPRVFALMTAAYASHLLLDMFSPDPLRFNGVPLLWPVSTREAIVPAQLFLDIRREEGMGFLASLWQIHNLHAILRELLIMAPLLLAVRLAKRAWSAARTTGAGLRRRADSES